MLLEDRTIKNYLCGERTVWLKNGILIDIFGINTIIFV